MNKDWTDMDMNSFLNGFAFRETKEEITNKYIKGVINKEEFIKRMRKASK